MKKALLIIDAQKAAVISICEIHGGDADNIIPESCYFSGTLRAFDTETADLIFNAVEQICAAVARLFQVEARLSIPGGKYPPVINPASGVKLAYQAAQAAGLPVRELEHPAMSSEDFSYFLLNAPDGVFVRLGAGEDQPPLHNSRFLPPPEVIPAGIAYMTAVALTALR